MYKAWGHDFLGHRFGWGPHRFACLSHPCRVSGPFLINLIVLNSDGGSDVFCSQILGFDPLTFLKFVRLDPKNLNKLYLVNMSIEGENERWYQNCAK